MKYITVKAACLDINAERDVVAVESVRHAVLNDYCSEVGILGES